MTGSMPTSLDYQVNYSDMASVAVNVGAGGSGNTLNVNSTAAGTPVTVNNNSGTDTINVNSTATGGPVIISPSAGNDPINVDTPGTGTAVAEFTASQQIGVLTMNTGGMAIVTVGARKLLQLTSITSLGTGVLDLTTNDMIVHGSNLTTVNGQVATGFNGGKWTGAGITSSSAANDASHLTALGVILNTYDGTHTLYNAANLFDGAAPSVTDILVKHTYYGDANLSGQTDGSDYSLIDNGYLHHLTGWYNGDFNYDGSVNGSDYTLIDNAYNTQGASLAAISAPAHPVSVAAEVDAIAPMPIAKPTAPSAPSAPSITARAVGTSAVPSAILSPPADSISIEKKKVKSVGQQILD
jgi:hypothetical protein